MYILHTTERSAHLITGANLRDSLSSMLASCALTQILNDVCINGTNVKYPEGPIRETHKAKDHYTAPRQGYWKARISGSPFNTTDIIIHQAVCQRLRKGILGRGLDRVIEVRDRESCCVPLDLLLASFPLPPNEVDEESFARFPVFRGNPFRRPSFFPPRIHCRWATHRESQCPAREAEATIADKNAGTWDGTSSLTGRPGRDRVVRSRFRGGGVLKERCEMARHVWPVLRCTSG